MNGRATLQSLMDDVFHPFLRKVVLILFDDILVYSSSEIEHVKHVQLVLQKQAEKLFANLKKCEFGKNKIGYLGHVVSEVGVAVDEDKVKAIMEWSQPRNIREYRKFVANYSHNLTVNVL